jgi:hypothetical protein
MSVLLDRDGATRFNQLMKRKGKKEEESLNEKHQLQSKQHPEQVTHPYGTLIEQDYRESVNRWR